MITLVDHRDSFTRNLEHLLTGFDEVKVIDRKVFSSAELAQSNLLVLSPGPGNPSDYPETQKIYQQAMGENSNSWGLSWFQLMMEQEGAEITRQKQVLHGVETEILADFNSATYRNMKGSIRVGRYHSLQVNPESLSSMHKGVKITGHDPIRQTPLSFEDLDRKLFGLQYHPESFLSNQGTQIISNILDESMA